MISWNPIDGFPGYWVSDQGRVRHWSRLLIARPNERGYLRVTLLTPEGKRVARRVHLLVLEAFVGPRPSSKHVGAHAPDRNPRNNQLNNLRWALPTENERDKKEHGTHRGGGRHWRPSRVRIATIHALAAAGESFSKIAKTHGLHRSSVSRIVRGLRRKDDGCRAR